MEKESFLDRCFVCSVKGRNREFKAGYTIMSKDNKADSSFGENFGGAAGEKPENVQTLAPSHYVEIIKEAYSAGTDLSQAVLQDGKTFADVSAENGYIEALKTLQGYGVAMDNTLVDIAMKNGHTEAAVLIQDFVDSASPKVEPEV